MKSTLVSSSTTYLLHALEFDVLDQLGKWERVGGHYSTTASNSHPLSVRPNLFYSYIPNSFQHKEQSFSLSSHRWSMGKGLIAGTVPQRSAMIKKKKIAVMITLSLSDHTLKALASLSLLRLRFSGVTWKKSQPKINQSCKPTKLSDIFIHMWILYKFKNFITSTNIYVEW